MTNLLTEALPARSLYIAVPAYTGQVSVQTAHSLLAAAKALNEAGLDVKTDFLAGCCYLDHSRNILVDHFMKSEATDLLFVDADVGFGVEAALKIAAAGRPVVAGVYPKKSNGEPEWPVDFRADMIRMDEDGLMEAAHVATGFLRINRSVFETFVVNGVAPEYSNNGEAAIRRYFRTEAREGVFWGEDFQFCEDWLGFGGAVHIIPDLEFQHVGNKTWTGHWGNWFRDYIRNRKEA